MSKKVRTPRMRRGRPLPPRQGRSSAVPPSMWKDEHQAAEAAGQLRLLDPAPPVPAVVGAPPARPRKEVP
jgi:hypothetical protein